jgi:predicted dehydrogenase
MAHRVGILGLGVMGERMLRSMAAHPAFEVTAAWDPAPEAPERLRTLSPEARFAADAAALVAAPDVTCVYVAAPPAVHLPLARLAFGLRKPVFCEKPLAVDRQAAREAVARVEGERLKAAVNFPFASAPAVRAIASGLKNGELGAVERIDIEVAFAQWPRPWQATARWLGERREGGFVREVLSHFLFLTRRLVGPLAIHDSHVDYPADGIAAETHISARLSAGGVPVRLEGHVAGSAPDHNRWTLVGQDGAFELYDWYALKRRIERTWLDVDFGEGELRQRAAMAQLDQLDAMLAGRPHHLPSFREGLEVLDCVEALLQGG